MIKKLFISTAICSALISSPVLATGTGTTADKQKDSTGMETNSQEYSNQNTTSGQTGDQQNQQNLQAGQQMDFDELDRDGDGQLSEEELNRYGATAAGQPQGDSSKRGEEMLNKYDQDNDDALSEEEYQQGVRSGQDKEGDDSGW